MYRRCLRVFGYLHCQFILTIRQWASRDATRKDYIQDKGQQVLDACNLWSWVYLCFLFLKPNPNKKIHQPRTLTISHSIFYLFDTLSEKFHKCHFDHLYMSAKISYTSFTHRTKTINTQGVCHFFVRGLQRRFFSMRW